MPTIQLHQVRRQPSALPEIGKRLDGIRRILLIRHDRLGDLILTLPALAALRETYPESRLGCMVAPELAPLAEMFEPVDDVLAYRGVSRVDRRAVRDFEPDLTICVVRSLGSAWAVAGNGIPHRVGSAHRAYSPLFNRRVRRHRRRGGLHEVDYALDFAHCGGAAVAPARFPLRLPDGCVEQGRQLVARTRETQAVPADAPLVVLHPGSGGSCPNWPVEQHRKLGQLLRERGWGVLISLGPGEVHWDAAAELGLDRSAIFRGGLRELCGLLRAADIVVGSSTGPLHLAAALGTTALAIQGPWASCGAARWGPYAANGWVATVGDASQASWSRRRRQREGAALLACLSPARVVSMLEQLVR